MRTRVERRREVCQVAIDTQTKREDEWRCVSSVSCTTKWEKEGGILKIKLWLWLGGEVSMGRQHSGFHFSVSPIGT
jgi:hypothetical protein